MPDEDDETSGFRYELKQHREVQKREVTNDPIVKFATAFDIDGYNNSVALRKSGKVDFYFNCAKTSSSESKQVHFHSLL